MRITDSSVTLVAEHQKIESYSKEEKTRLWIGERPDASSQGRILDKFTNDLVEFSKEAQRKLEEALNNKAESIAKSENIEVGSEDEEKLLLVLRMIEHLTGKKFTYRRINIEGIKNPAINVEEALTEQAPAQDPTQPSHGWGFEYDLREEFYQKETMSFISNGSVKTTDGRQIDFSVQLNMTREFAYTHQISFRAGDAVKVDPLVIHYDGVEPSLTSKKYEFDLDLDGTLDSISFAGPGSGFLALDKNGDGVINDGNELFGPQTGDGFTQLATYDEDNNGWIDENDSVFHRLLIWTKDDHGEDKLYTLAEQGIGAIYLGNVASPFELTSSQNESAGQIAKSGIFLKENGTAGIIQHIDLFV